MAHLVSLNKTEESKLHRENRKTSGNFNSIVLQSVSTSTPIAVLGVFINLGIACADKAMMLSIAGEILYHILKKQRVIFTPSSLMMTLANGSKTKREIQTTRVKICIRGRTLPLSLVAIPEAKGNNILLV